MKWLNKFKPSTGARATQAGCVAAGDVDGIQAETVSDEVVSETVDRERFEALKAENVRLGEQLEKAYIRGLRTAFNLVNDAEGRLGKRQIADMIKDEIRANEKNLDHE